MNKTTRRQRVNMEITAPENHIVFHILGFTPLQETDITQHICLCYRSKPPYQVPICTKGNHQHLFLVHDSLAAQFLKQYPNQNCSNDICLLVDSPNDQVEVLIDHLQHGWRGVLNSERTQNDLMKAINIILDGGLWFPRRALDSFIINTIDHYYHQEFIQSVSENFDLTKKEQAVMHHLLHGYSNKQIASQMFISLNTVKTHIKNIMMKTDCHSRHAFINKVSQL
jgi:DNA-binding NarL/FixJ family response regulator